MIIYYRNGSAKKQRNKDCIYAARQGMIVYSNNTMRNSILIKDAGFRKVYSIYDFACDNPMT